MTIYRSSLRVTASVAAFLVGAPNGAVQEIGVNDLRVSDMGPDGDIAYAAYSPAIAYNSTNNEYLIVWAGNDDNPPLADGEQQIYGQRIDAGTGVEIGTNDFPISPNPTGSIWADPYTAYNPVVSYNSADHEYLVVWWGNVDPTLNRDFNVWVRRLDASTDQFLSDPLRTTDFFHRRRISTPPHSTLPLPTTRPTTTI